MSVYEDAIEVVVDANIEDLKTRSGVTWLTDGQIGILRANATIGIDALRDAGLLREDDATPNE